MSQTEKTYTIIDFKDRYGPIMKFDKNKTSFIHQWYPFVEGIQKNLLVILLKK